MAKYYKDIKMDLSTVNPLTGDIGFLEDEDSVKNSVKNLILSNSKAIPFNRNKGTNIQSLLFESNNAVLNMEAYVMIDDLLRFFEPRVKLLSVKAKNTGNTLELSIVYNVLATNKQIDTTIQVSTVK